MQSFLTPEKILDQLDLKPDMIAAEFGCGSGSFVLALAKRLTEGLVYGLDIQKAPLSALKGRMVLENITNVQLICCDLEKPRGSTLSNSSLDLVLVPNILFQAEDKNAIIKEAERVLKNNGELVIIEWLPQSSQGPTEGRIPPEEIKKMAEKIGFKTKKELNAGIYHYGLVFKKSL